MKVFISYLIVFLLGWACAVWSYSDSIYTKVETSTEKPNLQEGINNEGN
jgi:hypothetical protein